ncbi:MAG: deoxycytidine triphosphate deaminase [Gammaproteobacteria bacterium]|nr:deoxycytidine triphosphate deaminase [Gammaproteobacteria bacterium]|tara:strand:- start:369 stop:674 length:306 start_codon:yes stop_codon:yes gene_type:complete
MAIELDQQQQTQIEAAVFRRLVEHLDERKDVQNIDLMNLAGFCRNCLSKWYRAACEDSGIEVDYEDVRERVYGMPYPQWKERFQEEASADQLADFERNKPN